MVKTYVCAYISQNNNLYSKVVVSVLKSNLSRTNDYAFRLLYYEQYVYRHSTGYRVVIFVLSSNTFFEYF